MAVTILAERESTGGEHRPAGYRWFLPDAANHAAGTGSAVQDHYGVFQMNLAGKFLTFLILIMSLVFLVLAVVTGASHQAWKSVAIQNKSIADTKTKLLEELKAQTTIGERLLQNEKVSRQQQLAQLYSELEKERMNRDAKEKELTEQLQLAQARLAAINRAEERLTQQDAEVAQLREQNKLLIDEIAARRLEVTTLTNQAFELRGSLEELKSRSAGISEQLAKSIKVLKANGLTENSLTDGIAPRIESVVMKADGELIVISAGTDDGLRIGHEVDIYRGDRFLGKAVISNPEYNMSAARVLAEYRQAVIREGDIVTTKLR